MRSAAEQSTPTSTASAPVQAARAFLAQHPPFNRLEPDALEWLAARLAIAYYAKGTLVLSPSQGVARCLYVVQRGAVERQPENPRDDRSGGTSVLTAGGLFPFDAMIEKRAPRSAFTAVADTFCYQLDADRFAALLERSPRLREYTNDYLGTLLRDSRRMLKVELAAGANDEQIANRPLHALIKRSPVTCAPDTSIEAALRLMHEARVGSILVVDPARGLVGILTRHDVLDRIALARRDLTEPVSSVMTPEPMRLNAEASAYDAALLIAREGIRHVPVVEGARVVGVVTERDLFALQRATLRTVRRTISEAESAHAFAAAANETRALARKMFEQGMAAEQLTYIISTLNDALTQRLIELERVRHRVDDITWCWLAFGSEGRYEQTISTDQDNGLVFEVPAGENAHELRDRLLPFAQAVNRALDECGFPLCKGEIMAGNARWCLSVAEWQARFTRWIDVPEPQELLNAVIFFDFRALHGETRLIEPLRDVLFTRTRTKPSFLRQLAQFAVESRPPLGLLGGFVDDDPQMPGTIDLKRSGARVFVDVARVLALAAEVPQTNTAQRLRYAGAKVSLTGAEIASAVEAFYFIQQLRLRTQLLASGRAGANRIEPARLNQVDASMLKEAFRQARKLQARLALDYQL
jgi:CBS domain-containing protein